MPRHNEITVFQDSEDQDGGVEVTASAEFKSVRRRFYTNFTERVLAKCGELGKGDRIIEDVRRKRVQITERCIEETAGCTENCHRKNSGSIEHDEETVAWRRCVDLTHRVPGASARLFCCPWAGGNSLAFDAWPERLPGVEVVPLLLPGRLTRAGEEALNNVSEIAAMMVEALCGLHLLTHGSIPFFFFGHEMGALVAFEICRRLQANFPVKGLFVSGMTCPQMVHEREKISVLCQVSTDGDVLHAKNSEFEDAIVRRGPVPAELRENKELMRIFSPLWFKDLSAIDNYEYESGTPLECPIYSFGGLQDGGQNMDGWAMETLSNRSSSMLYPGGLFFLLDHDNETQVLGFIHDRCQEEGGSGSKTGDILEGMMTSARATDDSGSSESSG